MDLFGIVKVTDGWGGDGKRRFKGNVKAFVLAPWKDVVAIYFLLGGLLSACA